MARLILKSPYLKPASKSRAANHLRYIATREGVVKPEDPKRQLSATRYQQSAVAELLKEYPDTAELHEYQDYRQSSTRENADEFILRVAETHGELFESRNKYVDYIATRPGAVHVAEHGLFTDEGKPVVLDQVAEEVALHKGNVWTHIISLRRENADRLGYNNVGEWMDLLRRQRNMLSKQMNIKPENFRWYAAFHDKEHHPHVHVMAWSSKPGEAWLSEKGIEGIKSAMARDIFQQDLVQIYQQQTQHRDALRQDSRTLAADIVRQIKAGGYKNQAMQELLMKLAERLKTLSGKKVYGYLPADAKATVDRIVDELTKDKRITQLYSLWYDQDWQQNSYVALCGVSDEAIMHQLSAHDNIKDVFLCLDNDAAGHAANQRIAQALIDKGYGAHFASPGGKDWNEDLVSQHQTSTEEMEEQPCRRLHI